MLLIFLFFFFHSAPLTFSVTARILCIFCSVLRISEHIQLNDRNGIASSTRVASGKTATDIFIYFVCLWIEFIDSKPYRFTFINEPDDLPSLY